MAVGGEGSVYFDTLNEVDRNLPDRREKSLHRVWRSCIRQYNDRICVVTCGGTRIPEPKHTI